MINGITTIPELTLAPQIDNPPNEEKKLDVPTEQQIRECDGSTGTHGDNHGNQPFLHVVFRTGQDARRFQKTQKVLNHDEMAQPPYG